MPEKVFITMPSSAEDEATVKSPFSAKDVIKDAVPPGYRWWDKAGRQWYVYEFYVQDLVRALTRAGFDPVVLPSLSAPKSSAGRTPVAASDWATATFSTCTSKDQVDAMHKALLRVHHPDKGGSPAMVEQINDAANRRRKQVY